MAAFTRFCYENETPNGRSRSGNSHLNHLISHSEVGSSSNHTPMLTQLGQRGQSQRLSDGSNMTITPSRKVHIQTIVDLDLDPIVVPNYQPPAAVGLGYTCALPGDHHQHYHHSSSVSHSNFFASPRIVNKREEGPSHPQPQPVGIDGGMWVGRLRSVHFNDGTYACPKCSRVFASSQLFAAHAKAMHYRGESPAERARRRAARARRRTNSNNLRLVVLDDNTITILPHDHEHFRGENYSQTTAATTTKRGGGTERNINHPRAAGSGCGSGAGPTSRSYVHESIRAKKKRAREMNCPVSVGGEHGYECGAGNGQGQAQVEDSGSGGPDHEVIVVEDD